VWHSEGILYVVITANVCRCPISQFASGVAETVQPGLAIPCSPLQGNTRSLLRVTRVHLCVGPGGVSIRCTAVRGDEWNITAWVSDEQWSGGRNEAALANRRIHHDSATCPIHVGSELSAFAPPISTTLASYHTRNGNFIHIKSYI
jgi:hypothetical protein